MGTKILLRVEELGTNTSLEKLNSELNRFNASIKCMESYVLLQAPNIDSVCKLRYFLEKKFNISQLPTA